MMPVGGILERTSSPVGKGAVCVSGGGGGEGPVLGGGGMLAVGFWVSGSLEREGKGDGGCI